MTVFSANANKKKPTARRKQTYIGAHARKSQEQANTNPFISRYFPAESQSKFSSVRPVGESERHGVPL